MPDSKSRRVTKSPDVLLQDLDGEAVLLNLVNGQYYGLDENSYHMYQMLLSTASIQDAYEVLLGQYEVDPSRLKADLDRFLALLLKNGLLTEADTESE